MNAQRKQRRVVIVGRPNVGKSAIFNRIVGRRTAIVHAQSGVTRDRISREVVHEDNRFELIDTGGLSTVDSADASDQVAADIRRQVDAALEDAAVALLVVDIEAGLQPLDMDIANWLRRASCTVLVAANKADNPERDHLAGECASLGSPVFPVSALHNRGFGELLDALIPALPAGDNPTAADPLRVAIVGRPNVGKSSYINRLLNSDRVIVSEVPGTTRDSIDVPFVVGRGAQARHYVLIDTAGMRRLGKIDSSVERFSHFRSEKSIRRADVCVLVLDATQGPTAQDKTIAARIIEARKGCLLLVNKCDLAEATQRRMAPELLRQMPFMSHCPVVFVSAQTGLNVRRSIEAIDQVAAQISAVLPTGMLNRAMSDAWERVQAPTVRGKRLKLFYTTQVGSEPIRIRLFVNDPGRVKPAYREYLIRMLRSRFGLEGAPVFLEFRPRHTDAGRSSPGRQAE